MPVLNAGRFSFHREDGSMRPGWAVAVFALMVMAGTGFEAVVPYPFLGREVWWRLRFGEPSAVVVLGARAAWALGVTWLACRMVHWPLGDAYLRDTKWRLRMLQGVGLGTVMLAVVTVIPVALGYEHFRRSSDGPSELGATFFWGALATMGIALSEELWMRGYALRQLHRAVGRWGAALGTGVWFGLFHWKALHITWMAIANIALVGIWLAFTVYRTGSLWLAVGFHFMWDWLEFAVMGEPMGANAVRAALLVRSPPRETLWTGGEFGHEAGLLNMMMVLALILLFAPWPRRRAAAA